MFFDAAKNNQKVAVHSPMYYNVAKQIKELGINAHPWSTIADLQSISNPDIIYVVSNFNSVDGQSFTDSQKSDIIKIAVRNNAVVWEDNPYDLTYFENTTAPTTISSNYNKTISIRTISKILAPGLRVGFIAADKEYIQKMDEFGITINLICPVSTQQIALNAFNYDSNYLEKLRAHNTQKWHSFSKVLKSNGFTDFQEVNGGIFVKVNLPSNINIESLVQEASERGVYLRESKIFYLDSLNRPFLRFNFVRNTEEDSKKAIEIISDILHSGLCFIQKN